MTPDKEHARPRVTDAERQRARYAALTPEQKAARVEANRKYQKAYARKPKTPEEKARAAASTMAWQKRNPEKVAASKDRYKAENPGKTAEYKKRWREKHRKPRAPKAPPPPRSAAVPSARLIFSDALYVAACAAVPKHYAHDVRDDLAADIILAVLEGHIRADEITKASRQICRDFWRNRTGYLDLPLDSYIRRDDGQTYYDVVGEQERI